MVINLETGTVISANFFNSQAIDDESRDDQEFVSVCIHPPDQNGITTASITTDVGLDDDTHIKGYPQFVIGTKFGNQFETSFRYYSNNDLPATQRWPVEAENLTGNEDYQFANLVYVSQTRGLGLPAFTNSLPEMHVTIDMDEQNVVGSERDVMLESWFYDTSANADLIGNNSVTGQPIVNTLNNIIGIGHPHYAELDNTLLELMVHIGPLSPNDVSLASRNPGQNQLTENYSGKDFDGDGIDDHFDVDSHVNAGTNVDPKPGIYSSGIDLNNDGIDDADLLPVTIGDYQYSIWYGESFLAPIIIFSRETNSSLQSNFDPLTPDMDLSSEGEISLPWNEFIDYTLNIIEPQLQLINQNEIAAESERTLEWMDPDDEGNNVFTKMRSPAGAISGIEFGIEPQTNAPSDLAYIATINKFDVEIDGTVFGLNDTHSPDINFASVETDASTTTISGSSTDNVGIDRNLLLIHEISTGNYWNGSAWTSVWSWFAPTGIENWTYDINLTEGEYSTTAWTWDTSNNLGNVNTQFFTIGTTDTTLPSVQINDPGTLSVGLVTISGTAMDNSAIGRNRLLIQNVATGQYWDGSAWTNTWSWFEPIGNETWSYNISLIDGDYLATAWTWDISNNLGNVTSLSFTVGDGDTVPPQVTIAAPDTPFSAGSVTISGTSQDNVAIDRNRLLIRDSDTGLYWNGIEWTSTWSWFSPTGSENWSYTLTLPTGFFSVTAWTWDTANNIGTIVTTGFTVGTADTTPPTIEIDPPGSPSPGLVTITGKSMDDTAIDRNRLLIRNTDTGDYWNGSVWTSIWSWFAPLGVDTWLYDIDLPAGNYTVTAWTWDTADNSGAIATVSFSISEN